MGTKTNYIIFQPDPESGLQSWVILNKDTLDIGHKGKDWPSFKILVRNKYVYTCTYVYLICTHF